ncbi:MAG: TetR family transcriptional regulator [Alphaproteobacteria bacterium]|nr:TetR family transcriptional regulator [Alphaproteobacteria bacterium]
MPREPRWDAVIGSAAALFSENGFAGTSVREVAERARITKAGLYYHIREKEDLLFRICDRSIAAVLEGGYAVLAKDAEPRARLAGIVRMHLEYFVRHPHNLRVLTREMGALSPEPRAQIAKLEHEYLGLIRGVIREGQASGVFVAVDATVAAFTVLTVMNNLFDWYDPKGRIGPDALVGQIEAILFDGIAADTKTAAEGGDA